MISDEGPQTGTAGGILLHRLLAGHPPGRLRVIARYVPTVGDPLAGVHYARLLTPWAALERSRFNRLKRSLRALGLVPDVPRETLDRLVGDFSPDLVLCVMQHASYYDAAWSYARRRNLPLVVIVHDINDGFEPVLPWARAAARRRDGRFYRFARCRLCVSPEMAGLCEGLYGARGDVLYPNRSPDLAPRRYDDSASLRTPGTLTLGFVGNLGYGYGTEILRLLPALREAGARVVIYGRRPAGPYAALAEATDVCDWRGFVPSAEAWAAVQRDCDAVWLPYPNPAGGMEQLFRYHFPSKLPEYLALGMPVLVTGPAYATGAKWAIAHPAAAVFSPAESPTEFSGLLMGLREQGALRRALAEAAWSAGEADFSPRKLEAEFRSHIEAAARTGQPAGPAQDPPAARSR
jgi:glycosyltransferase involved in cell wall biosynthesis